MRLLSIILSSVFLMPLAAENKYNVLLICVDDLRNELGAYGVKEIISPNFDRLASQSVVFDHHYVQVPTCGASRYALLTGSRPSTKKDLGNHAFAQLSQKKTNKAQSLPEIFKRNGYTTTTIGKVSHSPDGKVFNYNGSGSGLDEVPNAWSINKTPYGQWEYGWGCFFAYADGKHREDKSGYKPRYEFPEVEDNELPDGMNTDAALKQLEDLKDQRFFMALGFIKPHLPFVAPKKYLDLYKDTEIKLAKNQSRKKTAYGHNSGEFYKYQVDKKESNPLSREDQISAKKAYYACVSYIDAQLGRVLDKLKKLGLDQNTIVVLWGDHGWNLGDHDMWAKHTVLETALKSPLMIYTPGQKGLRSKSIVETVDIYPTLLKLCELQNAQTEHPLSGQDLSPLFEAKELTKNYAISHWGNSFSIRNQRFHLLAQKHKSGIKNIELYDHQNDPHETRNVAQEHPETTQKLLALYNQNTQLK